MSEELPDNVQADGPRFTRAQLQLVGFIAIVAVVNIAYRLVYATSAQQTAALFVGVPALLAVLLALLPRSHSAIGMIMKGTTLALLIACVVLPEGLLCLLFILPIVAVIAVVVGGTIDWARSRAIREGRAIVLLAIPLAFVSMEGVVATPMDAADHATASATLEATPDQVAAALAATPRFDTELPTFLTLGFNRPVSATGSGLEVGDHRTIEFTGGTHDDHPLRLFGVTGERSVEHRSEMHLSVVESRPGRVVFAIDHDMTMLARWADLDRATVTWEAIDSTTTRVSWRLEYERLLFPTMYFAPVERYGMQQAAGYLVDAVIVDQLP